MSDISIHLFEIRSATGLDLGALIDRISRTPKQQRWRSVYNHDMALLDTQRDAATGLRMLDFVKRREVGPGRIRTNSDIEAFQFAAGENFGEETAALWDQRRGWLVVQFNQHGVRAGSIANYFNSYLNDAASDWILTAKLDDQALQKLRSHPNIKKASLKFDVNTQMSRAMRESGVPLGAALDAPAQMSGSATVEVNFSMGHTRRFMDSEVGQLLTRVAAACGFEEGLKSAKITGRDDADTEDAAIDLMRDRIKGAVATRELVVEGARYTQTSRWTALRRIHAGWGREHG